MVRTRYAARYLVRAARVGDVKALRAIRSQDLSAAEQFGMTPAHVAAQNGHADFLRALHELGAAASFSAGDNSGCTPAHWAAEYGHSDCLRVLHALGAAATLLAAHGDTGHMGEDTVRQGTPAHYAAQNGHAECLRVLHELGAGLSPADPKGRTPAHAAAQGGHTDCLRVLHELGASLSVATADGETPTHFAAQWGHTDCLRVLHELGASLLVGNFVGWTPAYWTCAHGHPECLRVLHELGGDAILSAADDDTAQELSHVAAGCGAVECLRVLNELGAAASSFCAADSSGQTAAHYAAQFGQIECLRALHELLCPAIDEQVLFLRNMTIAAAAVPEVIEELEQKRSLSWSPLSDWQEFDRATPAKLAARAGHQECFQYLAEIGGATEFLAELAGSPGEIEAKYAWMLSSPKLLDLQCKRAWLSARLDQVVEDADAVALSLVAPRGNVLDGLCAKLGADEMTGAIADGTAAVGVDVHFADESASGDGLRREWFGLAVEEMLDPRRGLFLMKEGSRALEPNPDSATTAGPDHLSYFALLGRLVGLALYHRETLNASWTSAFVRAAFGYPITHADLQVDYPELHANQLKLLDMAADDLDAVGLTFVVESDEAIVYEAGSKRRRSTELRPGGSEIDVTAGNVDEYLQLYAEHLLVGAIRPQVEAFRGGLRVFISDELSATICTCCTRAEVQQLLCGDDEIDVDDWQRSAQYHPTDYGESKQVRWLWAMVREMSPEQRSKLLLFCTGSVKPPATGFDSLTGYGGQVHRFKVSRLHDADAGRLPTASTCFNTLNLPAYASEAELRMKLQQAISGAQGFHEGAIAQ